MSLELPVLRLGLIGFSEEQQEYLTHRLKTHSGVMTWQVVAFSDADAWFVNGARVQALENGVVRVPAAEPTSRATQLNLNEVDRPIAFSLPLAPGDFKPLYTFDPASRESLAAVLAHIETWLKPLVAQFAVAGALVERQADLKSDIYHLSVHGSLVAVIDLHGDVGITPAAGPADIEQAEWGGRPESAGTIPPHFDRVDLSQLMWQFATRSTRDLLPVRYRTAKLYFRRSPRVPHRMLKDTHLVLIRELALAPGTFVELQDRTGIGEVQMARALAALYFVGGITTSRERAARQGAVHPGAGSQSSSKSGLLQSLLEGDSRFRPSQGQVNQDLTAPAPLQIRRSST